MGIRIPTLKAIEPTSKLPSPGRINIKAQDQSRNILGNVKALTSLIKTGSSINEHFENETANELSDKNNLKLADWDKQAAGTLSAQMKADPFADPNKLYVEFDKAKEAKYQEILAENGDANERVKGIVKSNLDRTMHSTRSADLQQRSYHKEIYQNNIYQATLKNNQEQLPKLASHIVEGDVTSTNSFNDGIHVMKTAVVKRAMSTHGAVKVDKKENSNFSYIDAENETVFVKVDNNTLVKMAQQTGEGVKNSIEAMISSNQVEKAKSMLDWYGNTMDSKTRSALDEDLSGKLLQHTAQKNADAISVMPEGKREAALNKLKGEEKSKTLGIMSTDANRRASLKRNRQNTNYELLDNKVDEMMSSGQANGFSDLEKTNGFQQLWKNMSPSQKKTIEQKFNSPKKSNPEVIETTLDLFTGSDVSLPDGTKVNIETISNAQWSQLKTGMTDGERSKYDTKFLARKNTKTNVTSYNNASKMLKTRLFAAGLLEKTDGKLKGKYLERWNKAQTDLMDEFYGSDEKVTSSQFNEKIKSYVESNKKDMIFGKGWSYQEPESEGWLSSLFGGGSKSESAKVVEEFTYSGDPLAGLERTKKTNLKRAYNSEHGGRVKESDPNFLQYVYNERKNGKF